MLNQCLGELNPRRLVLVHRVLAHHTTSAQLVHESLLTGNQHPDEAIRTRHVRRRGASLAHLHPSGHDASHTHELNVRLLYPIRPRSRARLHLLARAHRPAQALSSALTQQVLQVFF